MVLFTVPWREALDTADNFSPIGLARDVAALACRLRQQRPWLFDTVVFPYSPPTGAIPAVSQFAWNRICNLFPPDPSAVTSQPFQGGQCPGVNYRIETIDPQRGIVGPTNSRPVIIGPISSIRVVFGPSGWQNNTPFFPLTYTIQGVAANGAFNQGTDTRISTPQRDVRGWYFSIARSDGQPDTCGSVPPVQQLPVLPPPNQITINAPIFNQQRDITITLPEYDVTNWPNYEWSPVIEFDGIRAEFTTEGITLDLPDGVVFNPPVNINPVIENINNTTNNVDTNVNDIENATENITNIVENIQTILNNGTEVNLEPVLEAIRCYCGEESVTYGTQQIVTGSPGGVFNLPENTIAVLISGSNFDPNFIRTQDGGGNSPTVFYWGWASINYAGASGGERIPLQFESQSLACAENATSVLVSPTYNSSCSVIAITKELNCNVNG